MDRVVMLIDLDYFFAQCEELRNQSWKDKPVVVCVYSGRTEDSGAVSTANYVARKYGVKSGMPIVLAKKALKNVNGAVFPKIDREYYEVISDRVMNLLRTYADKFEQVSVDEAFLDVSERTHTDFEAAYKLSTEIQSKLLAEEKLTCSIGVGNNKLIAKLAADHKKPKGLTVIKPSEVRDFISGLEVGKLYGVGVRTEKRLKELGIETVGQLASFDVSRLTAELGNKVGVYLHRAANGEDDEPVQEREGREQISRISTLKANTRDEGIVLQETRKLSEEIHKAVIQEGLLFRSVSIIAIMNDLKTHSRSKTLGESTNSLNEISRVAEELSKSFLKEENNQMIRRIGVRVSNLSRPSGQTTLSEYLA